MEHQRQFVHSTAGIVSWEALGCSATERLREMRELSQDEPEHLGLRECLDIIRLMR